MPTASARVRTVAYYSPWELNLATREALDRGMFDGRHMEGNN